jgi:hypothetical protein
MLIYDFIYVNMPRDYVDMLGYWQGNPGRSYTVTCM